MSREYRAVLMVDDDLGFTFALADALASRGIALVPARSVTQARSLFKSLKPNVGLLIINCRVHGVCALAAEMVPDDRSLAVAGIRSAQAQCGLFITARGRPPIRIGASSLASAFDGIHERLQT